MGAFILTASAVPSSAPCQDGEGGLIKPSPRPSSRGSMPRQNAFSRPTGAACLVLCSGAVGIGVEGLSLWYKPDCQKG